MLSPTALTGIVRFRSVRRRSRTMLQCVVRWCNMLSADRYLAVPLDEEAQLRTRPLIMC